MVTASKVLDEVEHPRFEKQDRPVEPKFEPDENK